MVYRNPVYHQIVFASLIIVTALRITYILQLSDASRRIPAKAKKTIIHFFSTGAALFSLGFLIWNVDNIFCHTLTMWKVKIGWPAAFLLEGEYSFGLFISAHAFLNEFLVFGTRPLLVACFNCTFIFEFSSVIRFSRSKRDYGRVLGLITNSSVSNVRPFLHFPLNSFDGLADMFSFMFLDGT